MAPMQSFIPSSVWRSGIPALTRWQHAALLSVGGTGEGQARDRRHFKRLSFDVFLFVTFSVDRCAEGSNSGLLLMQTVMTRRLHPK